MIQKSIFTPELCDCQANFPLQILIFHAIGKFLIQFIYFDIFCQAHNKIINHFLKRQKLFEVAKETSRADMWVNLQEAFDSITVAFHCVCVFFSGSLRETFNFVYLRRQLSRSRSQKWKKRNAGRRRQAVSSTRPVLIRPIDVCFSFHVKFPLSSSFAADHHESNKYFSNVVFHLFFLLLCKHRCGPATGLVCKS